MKCYFADRIIQRGRKNYADFRIRSRKEGRESATGIASGGSYDQAFEYDPNSEGHSQSWNFVIK